MKIVIVGSDGRKFNEEQEEKAKATIYCIFARVALGKDLTKKQLKMVLEKDVTSFDYSNLTLVSGHCPVGEEMWYCIDCNSWKPSGEEGIDWDGFHGGRGDVCVEKHRVIKVYDNGGIDTWAEIIATKLGIPTKIFKPEVNQWNDSTGYRCSKCGEIMESQGYPVSTKGVEHVKKTGHMAIYFRRIKLKGFRSRNIDMAKIGTIGYTIEVAGSCRHCGGTGRQKKADEEGDGWYYDPRESCNKCKGTGAYSGGTFTINWMKKLGKETHQVII